MKINNRLVYVVVAVVALILFAGTFSGGLLVGRAMPVPGHGSFPTNTIQTIPTVSTSTLNSTQESKASLDALFGPFWEAWKLVHQEYVDQPVNDETLMQGAIRGMLQSLGDPHTSYIDPNQVKQLNIHLSGEYEGIGAWVDITGDYLTIVSPMVGYPAEKAGLLSGDKIIKINGEDMTGVDSELTLQHVLGPAGTTVTLTIQRDSVAEPFDVVVERAKISVPSVTGKMLDNNIAYVQISTFGDQTTEQLRSTLKQLMANKPVGLIVDLRNNGGGYLDTAIQVVSEFIKADQVVTYTDYGNGKREILNSLPGGLATDIPMVVLVNGGTASASEITAGAIQDYQRGLLVGVKTYGKGSVQNISNLSNNEGEVRITVAHWLTPKERQIDKVGLTPDVVVTMTADDVKAGRDPQLDKAIELLLKK